MATFREAPANLYTA